MKTKKGYLLVTVCGCHLDIEVFDYFSAASNELEERIKSQLCIENGGDVENYYGEKIFGDFSYLGKRVYGKIFYSKMQGGNTLRVILETKINLLDY